MIIAIYVLWGHSLLQDIVLTGDDTYLYKAQANHCYALEIHQLVVESKVLSIAYKMLLYSH